MTGEILLRNKLLTLLRGKAVPSSNQTELEVLHLLLLPFLNDCLVSYRLWSCLWTFACRLRPLASFNRLCNNSDSLLVVSQSLKVFELPVITQAHYVSHGLLVSDELFVGDVESLRLPVIKDLLSHYHLDIRALLSHKVPGIKVGNRKELQKLTCALEC